MAWSAASPAITGVIPATTSSSWSLWKTIWGRSDEAEEAAAKGALGALLPHTQPGPQRPSSPGFFMSVQAKGAVRLRGADRYRYLSTAQVCRRNSTGDNVRCSAERLVKRSQLLRGLVLPNSAVGGPPDVAIHTAGQ